jgi:hypothetical protein
MMRRRPVTSSEFAVQRGERQRPGDPSVYGIIEAPRDLPIAPIPTVRQVVSIFDSRPVGSRDFLHSVIAQPEGDPVGIELRFLTVDGYITVVRRIELEVVTGLAAGALPIVPYVLRFAFDEDLIPDWRWVVSSIAERSIDTFIPIEPRVRAGLRFVPTPSTPLDLVFIARYSGTLLLNRGLPVVEVLGSEAVRVRSVTDE